MNKLGKLSQLSALRIHSMLLAKYASYLNNVLRALSFEYTAKSIQIESLL
jgi:hypothetical protein